MKKLLALPLSLLLFAFASCSTYNKEESRSTEELLVLADFQRKPLTASQQKAFENSVTPYKVQKQSNGSNLRYVYWDPKNQVMYVGGAEQYAKFQQLDVEESGFWFW